MINSFDVFDTLIGRLTNKGHSIFEIIEKQYNLVGFKEHRIRCEMETENFDRTYELLGNIYNSNLDNIKQAEIDLEYELSFPIMKYLKRVNNDDILISDMYLSGESIMRLINKHLPLKNKIHVSYGGKLRNIIWQDKVIVSNIKCHYGDNHISDYQNPRNNGINAEFIEDTVFSETEKNVSQLNLYLASILKAVRLSYIKDDLLFNSFVNYVLPFSILVCIKLKKIIMNKKYNSLVFLSRDGYWFKEMYSILFPKDKIHYVYFSRLLCNNNREKIITELNNIKGNNLIFDLQGSGKTFASLNISKSKYFMCFKSSNCQADHYMYEPGWTNINMVQPYIEDLFLAPHGSASHYEGNEILLKDPEHDLLLYSSYFEGFKLFKTYYSTITKYFPININYNNLGSIIKNFHKNTENLSGLKLNLVNTVVPHVENHTDKYSGIPLKYYSQIGQDKYYIENIIKFKQDGIFLEIGGYDGITGSNTYFLERYLNWKGVVVECNPELFNKCKENRSCEVCDKAVYLNDNSETIFVIPLGEEIEGGKLQLSGIKETLKKESLVAFQGSFNSTKEIKVKTISINTLLETYNILNIDYLSIDTEGSELSILQCLDFTKYKIHYLTIEHGNVEKYKTDIYNFLINKGFSLVRNNRWDDEYILN